MVGISSSLWREISIASRPTIPTQDCNCGYDDKLLDACLDACPEPRWFPGVDVISRSSACCLSRENIDLHLYESSDRVVWAFSSLLCSFIY